MGKIRAGQIIAPVIMAAVVYLMIIAVFTAIVKHQNRPEPELNIEAATAYSKAQAEQWLEAGREVDQR